MATASATYDSTFLKFNNIFISIWLKISNRTHRAKLNLYKLKTNHMSRRTIKSIMEYFCQCYIENLISLFSSCLAVRTYYILLEPLFGTFNMECMTACKIDHFLTCLKVLHANCTPILSCLLLRIGLAL